MATGDARGLLDVADFLALRLLGADAAADGRQAVGLLELARGGLELAPLDELDEARDVDARPGSRGRSSGWRSPGSGGPRPGRPPASRPEVDLAGSPCSVPRPRARASCWRAIFMRSLTGTAWRSSLRQSWSNSAFSRSLSSGGIFLFLAHVCPAFRPHGKVFLFPVRRATGSRRRNRISGGHEQLLPVDRVAVEIRPVDAGELGLAADGAAAGAAHARAVDHDRVQADHGLDAVRPGGLGAGVHEVGAADGDDPVDRRLRGSGSLELGRGCNSFGRQGAVAGGDDEPGR